MSTAGSCELCSSPGEPLIWSGSRCRVVLVDNLDFPGYCKVIWNCHVVEMTDLSSEDRSHLMAVVFAVEAAVRGVTSADKINLASFGNFVAHLHWHVIPRWRDDPYFPNSSWGAKQREACFRRVDLGSLVDSIKTGLSNVV